MGKRGGWRGMGKGEGDMWICGYRGRRGRECGGMACVKRDGGSGREVGGGRWKWELGGGSGSWELGVGMCVDIGGGG